MSRRRLEYPTRMTEDSSITHRAYVEIRAALIACRLPPGSRLNIAQLQREIGVSQAAVREALSRLTAEGLATIERNSGFRAAPIAADGYRELSAACLTIEVPLLRSAIQNGDYVWEGALLSVYHVASRVLSEAASDSIGVDAYFSHREEFHQRLFSACAISGCSGRGRCSMPSSCDSGISFPISPGSSAACTTIIASS